MCLEIYSVCSFLRLLVGSCIVIIGIVSRECLVRMLLRSVVAPGVVCMKFLYLSGSSPAFIIHYLRKSFVLEGSFFFCESFRMLSSCDVSFKLSVSSCSVGSFFSVEGAVACLESCDSAFALALRFRFGLGLGGDMPDLQFGSNFTVFFCFLQPPSI